MCEFLLLTLGICSICVSHCETSKGRARPAALSSSMGPRRQGAQVGTWPPVGGCALGTPGLPGKPRASGPAASRCPWAPGREAPSAESLQDPPPLPQLTVTESRTQSGDGSRSKSWKTSLTAKPSGASMSVELSWPLTYGSGYPGDVSFWGSGWAKSTQPCVGQAWRTPQRSSHHLGVGGGRWDHMAVAWSLRRHERGRQC